MIVSLSHLREPDISPVTAIAPDPPVSFDGGTFSINSEFSYFVNTFGFINLRHA